MNSFMAIYQKRLSRRFSGVKHFLLDNENKIVFATDNIGYITTNDAGKPINDFFCEDVSLMQTNNISEAPVHFEASPAKEFTLIMQPADDNRFSVRYSCYLVESEAERPEINHLRTKLLQYNSIDNLIIPSIELFGGQIVYANESFARLCGYSLLIVHSMRLSNLVTSFSKAIAKRLENGELINRGEVYDIAFSRQDGSISHADASVSVYNGETHGIVIGFVETTEKKRLEQANSMYTKLLSNLDDGVVICDKHENIFWCNAAFTKITGYDKNGYPTLVQSILKKYPELHSSIIAQVRDSTFRRSETSFDIFSKDGESKHIEFEVFPLSDNMYALIVKDISAHNEIEKTMQSLKIADPFTGLWAPEYFVEQYEKTFRESKAQGTTLTLAMIEISNFRNILQNNGPKTANNVLKIFALRAADENGGRERICRIGEARFAVYYTGQDYDSVLDGINKMMNKMDMPFVSNGRDIFVKTSIGAGMYPYNSINSDELFNFTRAALEKAKSDKRSAYALMADSIHLDVISHKHSLEFELISALENDEFTAYFQPRGAVTTHSLTGGEALMRWESPVYGIVSPAYFLELAKETDMLIPLGYKIIELVCANINEWNKKRKKPVVININLTHEQLVAVDFVATLQSLLAQYNVDPTLIEFEVSETDEQSNRDKEAEIISHLKQIGLSVSVDNFGTGVTSIASYDVSSNKRLTIERSTVCGLEFDSNSREKAQQIISLAKDMGLTSLAKGVENEKQLQILRDYGCDYYQGYYLCKPIPAVEFGAYLEADSE